MDPWLSFYTPEEMAAAAIEAGLRDARTMATAEIAAPYLADRTDGLAAAGGEGVLIART